MRRASSRGLSVLEMLVAAAILLTIVGLVGAVLEPGLTAWRRSEIRSDIQGNALLSMHAVQNALSSTRASSVAIFPHQWTDPVDGTCYHCDGFAVLSPADDEALSVTNDGQWSAARVFLCYVRTDDRSLWTASINLPPSAAPTSASDALPPDVRAAMQGGQAMPSSLTSSQRVGRFLQSFQVVQLTSTGAANTSASAPTTSVGVFVISLRTASAGFACTLETAITPTLDSLEGP